MNFLDRFAKLFSARVDFILRVAVPRICPKSVYLNKNSRFVGCSLLSPPISVGYRCGIRLVWDFTHRFTHFLKKWISSFLINKNRWVQSYFLLFLELKATKGESSWFQNQIKVNSIDIVMSKHPLKNKWIRLLPSLLTLRKLYKLFKIKQNASWKLGTYLQDRGLIVVKSLHILPNRA